MLKMLGLSIVPTCTVFAVLTTFGYAVTSQIAGDTGHATLLRREIPSNEQNAELESESVTVDQVKIHRVNTVPDNVSEVRCQIVSSHGIMKSCDVQPENVVRGASLMGMLAQSSKSNSSNLTFYSLLSKVLDAPTYLKNIVHAGNGSVVYVQTSVLPAFVDEVLPQISTSFVLVTGDFDWPPDFFGEEKFQKLIEDKRLLRWFAQDAVRKHPKLTQIPIGLDYHTISENAHHGWGPMKPPVDQEKDLIATFLKSPPFENRSSALLTVFTAEGRGERTKILDDLKHSVNADIIQGTELRQDFWDQIGKHKYVVSPPGGGMDCHRTWEVLAMGAVPIVQASPFNSIFKDNNLTVVEVDVWKDINPNDAHAPPPSDGIPAGLRLDYWVRKIRAASGHPLPDH